MLERDIMSGLAKGLKAIEAFTAEKPRQSIADVASTTGLDRATARRCLLTLAHLGYAEYDGKYFTLTPRILRLGTACLATLPLPQLVQPLLDRLSDETGESSSVAILDSTDVVYVARAAQRKVMSIALMPGSRLPAFCTSLGRVMLSSLALSDATAILESAPRLARTPNTIVDLDALLAVIQSVREAGYALIDQEVEIGLRSIAVPLLNSRGKTIAALNIGLRATSEPVNTLTHRYLPAMLKVQSEVRVMLN